MIRRLTLIVLLAITANGGAGGAEGASMGTPNASFQPKWYLSASIAWRSGSRSMYWRIETPKSTTGSTPARPLFRL